VDVTAKDVDVVVVVAVAHPFLLQDMDLPLYLSWQEGHQGTWDLRPQAEDIMHHRPKHSRSSPPLTQPS
jgi:hypothetical protein